MTNSELKAYIKSKLNVEDEKALEEATKRTKRVLENSLFGMTRTDNILSITEKDIEKALESKSKGKVKGYSLTLSGIKIKGTKNEEITSYYLC